MEDWAEIRRLHRSVGLSQAEVARRLGISRNTVARALRSTVRPAYQRRPRGSVADAFEPQIRALLSSYPTMPATVIAQRIGWPHSISPLKVKLQRIRPEYRGIDPADRLIFAPGQTAQMDLWFPAPRIPVGAGQQRVLPVLVMALGFSRVIDAVMIPSRQAGDLLSGMRVVIERLGRVPRTIVWDRESAIAGKGKPTQAAVGFFGTLATGLKIAPVADPEFKGLVERCNQYLETSFLPGRVFTSPTDFNEQLAAWLPTANMRTVRRLSGRPVDFLDQDRAAMLDLPPVAPTSGLAHRVRLSRDYYVRVDGNDYSVDPRFIGRFVDAHASLSEVSVRVDGQVIARHERCWAARQTISDPDHVITAARLRAHYQTVARRPGARHHLDGHPVQLRALSDYDAMFGVSFDQPHQPSTTDQEGATS